MRFFRRRRRHSAGPRSRSRHCWRGRSRPDRRLVNGLLIARLELSPFVTTLGMLSVARGLSLSS